jgi:hypothetical protein
MERFCRALISGVSVLVSIEVGNGVVMAHPTHPEFHSAEWRCTVLIRRRGPHGSRPVRVQPAG